MKILAKQNRGLIMINAQNTQNENYAEKIILKVPEQYEDFNKKIVFVTPDGNVWDIITNNEYLIPKAITKYQQVDFYIWLTKGDVDFRSQTKTLKFYHNVDATGEITPEEISGVNTVVNLLEEEIEKVEGLEDDVNDLIADIQNRLDNGEFKGDKGDKGDKGEKGDTYDDTELKNDISSINANIKANYYNKEDTDTKLDTKANTSDVYNKTETDEKLESKQDKLTAGTNITISNNTISAKDTTYSTATSSTDGLMSKNDKSKLDGLSNYNDTTVKNDISTLKTGKQDKLTAGTNITISDNTISVKDTYSTSEIKIGTFDGKALYRRCYIGTPTFANRHWINIDTSTWGIGSLINVHGMVKVSRDNNVISVQPIPRIVPDNISGFGIGFGDMNSDKIGILFGTGYTSINKLILVIEYTKETLL